jgi:hypothetical protein
MVDPGGVNLGVLLLLFSGRLGIMGPEGEVFAIIADGETCDINWLRF